MTKRRVELAYDPDCPNVNQAREHLREAFRQAGIAPAWQEWLRSDPQAPDYMKANGSPTILIDGEDVARSSSPAGEDSCRLYRGADGTFQGVPTVDLIVSKLKPVCCSMSPMPDTPKRDDLLRLGAVLPGIIVAFLPVLGCPACWPAYVAIMSSLGLGFLANAAFLLPLTPALLIVAVVSLGWGVRERRQFGPLILGAISSAAIFMGKFVFDSRILLYASVFALLVASLWKAGLLGLVRLRGIREFYR